MNLKSQIDFLFHLTKIEVGIYVISIIVNSFFMIVSMIGALVYGDFNLHNPYWIMCMFFSLNIVAHSLLFDSAENVYHSQALNGFILGGLKITTAVFLCLVAFGLENRAVEGFIWTVIALWFAESGLRNVLHSFFILRAKYRAKAAELIALNERIRIENEIAARWAEQEAERKRKAQIEEELITDLEAFLSSPDPNP